MKESLLTEFFQNQLDNYREPQRQGTPRGERIGLSKVKFYASLFALLNSDLRAIAKHLGVSYGLLRKWRTEKEFKKVVNDHCDRFTVIIFKHLLELADENKNKENDFLKLPLEEIASSKLPDTSYNWERLSDCLAYSDAVNIKLCKAIDNVLELKFDEFNKNGIIVNEDKYGGIILITLSFLFHIRRDSNKYFIKYKDIEHKMYGPAKSATIGIIRDILLKPEITEEARKKALYALASLDR